MKFLSILPGRLVVFFKRLFLYFEGIYERSLFAHVGQNCYIGHDGIFSYQNIEIGNDTYVGPRCVFQSSYGKIRIGSHCMFGTGVHIHGGNHRINEIGRLLKHTSEKRQGDDGLVLIEDDCWIGSNAIILSRVTIGKGTVIGAGAIVTKDIPPYSIYTGSPPHSQLRNRFDENTLKQHIHLMNEQ
ncbi:acyltransferase [uncultured Alistipes sp.]|uniref:acyltransferase n=1 Tax=uncultured Alistipes sp. TaxID=538949 RepID=UPI0025898948|nr:acyltransferase [uncultured Alistipes sp.]